MYEVISNLYYSTSSLTNQIAPFEGNNVGYCTLLWRHVMTPDDYFTSFECRACVHEAQYRGLAPVIDIDDVC